MFAFVVLDLVFPCKPRDWLGDCLRNDLFCVESDVKPQLNSCGKGGGRSQGLGSPVKWLCVSVLIMNMLVVVLW